MGDKDGFPGAGDDHGGRGARGSGRPRRPGLTGRPAVVVPAFRRPEASRRALASLVAAGAGPILLVDDEGSADGGALAHEFPGVELIATDRPHWWTGCIVLGATRALEQGHEAILFFNQDVVCAPDYFSRLAEAAAARPGALVGSAVLYAHDPDRVWSAGGAVEWWGRGLRGRYHRAPVGSLPDEPFEADWLYGMGTLVPRTVFERIGLPDATRFPQAFGDVDFSMRAKEAGIPVLVAPRARLFHEVGAYDPHAAGPPSARLYVSWLRDGRHNLSLASHAALW
ncbi:MAG TPA: glycosyltransferase family 2 protein, partial [Thermoanaerobaculia bacterium]|nr:glycosyltransferase family 2 protein [Thermoanaerobaculia bacterium]